MSFRGIFEGVQIVSGLRLTHLHMQHLTKIFANLADKTPPMVELFLFEKQLTFRAAAK